ncbi:MAG: YheV family putative zinc ribbon protein [Porticoccaceae bacterium]
MSTVKRFVAGAVCPRCSASDRIRVYRENDRLFQDCIACGFRAEMNPREPAGEASFRRTESGDQAMESPQPITLIATSGPKKDSD